jgi:signal transduction histidine kinase
METYKSRITITFWSGIMLIVVGILWPMITEGWTSFIIGNLEESITRKDSGNLVILSIYYTIQHAFFYFFIFFGTLLMIDEIFARRDPVYRQFCYAAVLIIILLLVNMLYHDNFSIIGQLMVISMLFFIQNFIPKQKNYYVIYSVILFFVLMAISWMQLIPAFSKFGVGTNDIAISLKTTDQYLTGSYLLNTLAIIFMLLFLMISMTLTFLVLLLNKQISTVKKIQEHESELKAAKVALVESKVYEEINSLVHDLKTPLSTLEGLTSLIKMRSQHKKLTSIDHYLDRMSTSIQKMNDMISEILYEDNKQPISVKELLEYVTSHLILAKSDIAIEVSIEEEVPNIYVNKIRFSRAVSNILENAIASLNEKAGIIHVNVKKEDRKVFIQIVDNGSGIESAHLDSIWHDGFSTKNSSGIGLSFVKNVVESHFGTIDVSSVPGSHTRMTILLPIYEEGEISNERQYISR